MALEHRISDALQLRIDKDTNGNSVVEIEFKFIRYRLTLDNKEKTKKMIELLLHSLKKQERVVEKDESLPHFYKNNDSESPL